jgi:hypothetical protein
MDRLPVLTLPDGTAIEIPMPSSSVDPESHGDVHHYRVRGPSGTLTFATLRDAADHVMHLPDHVWRRS